MRFKRVRTITKKSLVFFLGFISVMSGIITTIKLGDVERQKYFFAPEPSQRVVNFTKIAYNKTKEKLKSKELRCRL